jgi:phage terminase large subunit-like protein
VVQSKVWTPEGDRIDHSAIKQHLRALSRKYMVKRIVADPRYFELIAVELLDEGLPVMDYPQSPERMYPACANAYELIVSNQLIHGGDATLTDHVLSAAQRQTDRGWMLSKGRSKRKIDACIALVMAAWEATRVEQVQTPSTLIYFN